jgi:putative serine protease PepD
MNEGGTLKQFLLPLALVVAAVGGGVVGAGVMAAVEDDGTTATATVTGREVADRSQASTPLASLYKEISPSVVEISVEAQGDSPFGTPQGGTGTGWMYDATHIVTNQHVIDGTNEVTIRFEDGRQVQARVVGSDPSTDVALLEIDEGADAPAALERGSTESLEVGDPVVAIGSPFGLEGSLTTGVVSGLGRTIQAPDGFTIDDVVQTDAALNPGNSGGPLLDLNGRVVGMNAQIASQSGSNSGIGYAIPIETVQSVVDQLLADGQVEHAYLGVQVADAENNGGARIVEAVQGGPADDAGVQQGDVVVSAGGDAVQNGDDLRNAVDAQKPGDELELELRRDGETRTVTVELGTRPAGN